MLVPAGNRYDVDPDDPRAPPQDVWERLSEKERARVVESLPSEFPKTEECLPEGDPHLEAMIDARLTMRDHFKRLGRKIYIGTDLPVYYPGERMFSPDVIAVLDVEPHQRMRWAVSTEGKGLDLAIEIHVAGDRRKDLERNVERYARLGIGEYFIFDRGALRLTGYRLEQGSGGYRRIMPQGGLYPSAVLGLGLRIEDTRLRFYHGNAPVLDASEMISRLEQMTDSMQARLEEEARLREEEARLREEEARLREEEARLREEEARLREEEARLREEAEHKLAETERKLAEALAKLESLKRA